MARAFAGLALGSTLGCSSTPRPLPPRLGRARVRGVEVTLSVPREGGDASIAWLLDALAHTGGRLARFSLQPREPLLVRLHATIAAFVEATGQTAPWLRAWSGWATVDLLALRFWDDDSTVARRERLTHELSHCALFQAFKSRQDAIRANIPWWFLEGAASVVADQQARRMPRHEVIARAGGRNPLDDERLATRDHALAYGAAHHVVAAWLGREGDDAIARVLASASNAPASGLSAALRSEFNEGAASLWAKLLKAP